MKEKEIEQLKERSKILSSLLDEKSRRLYYAAEAKALGRGGIGKVFKATGASRTTISTGLAELKNSEIIDIKRTRKKGGGRKQSIDKNPQIELELSKLLEPALRGEPDSPLMWTSKSLRKLSAELKSKGLLVSHKLVGEILKKNGFSLQANRKTDEGKSHPDRNAQFEHIHFMVKFFQKENHPVISIDAKRENLWVILRISEKNLAE